MKTLPVKHNACVDSTDPFSNAHTLRTPKHGGLYRYLLLFNTTRMVPGPPSTGVAIAKDGGMADTACYYTGR